MWAWNCAKDDLSRRTNISLTYLHQTVGMTVAGLSIASSKHSVKILASAGEMGEPTMGEHYLYKFISLNLTSMVCEKTMGEYTAVFCLGLNQ